MPNAAERESPATQTRRGLFGDACLTGAAVVVVVVVASPVVVVSPGRVGPGVDVVVEDEVAVGDANGSTVVTGP